VPSPNRNITGLQYWKDGKFARPIEITSITSVFNGVKGKAPFCSSRRRGVVSIRNRASSRLHAFLVTYIHLGLAIDLNRGLLYRAAFYSVSLITTFCLYILLNFYSEIFCSWWRELWTPCYVHTAKGISDTSSLSKLVLTITCDLCCNLPACSAAGVPKLSQTEGEIHTS
jgi:hypothetical protein